MNPNRLSKLLKRKYFPFLIVILAVVFLVAFFLLQASSTQEFNSQSATQPDINPQLTQPIQRLPNTQSSSGSNQTIQLQQAIDEAKKSAIEFDYWQADLRTNYPWLRRFPVAGEKYYVYFDLNKDTFIALLYPQAGDNLAQIKADISNQLYNMGINLEDYQFEWRVSTP